jgi:glycosyltransferase involved in cell wall biosynthesis
MHICFIEDTPLHGGTQIWVTEATRNFLAKGHQVTVLAPHDTWMVGEIAATSARVVTYDWEGVVGQGDDDLRIWQEALAPCDVAVCTVHPPRDGFHCSIFAAKAISSGGLKTHLIPKTGTIVAAYLRAFYEPDPSIASSVIAITGFTRDYLVDDYRIDAQKVALLYQGTEIGRFQPSEAGKVTAAARYRLPDHAHPVLGCIGSLEERKGQTALLQALQKVISDALPNAHLMLVGDGPDEQMLRAKVSSMELSENVTFFPFTREPTVVFERIDITVLSSLFKEGLPNVLLESLAMEVPVVATRLAGVPEIVIEGRTGLLVEPGDVDALAEAIIRLGSDPDGRRRMGVEGRALIAAEHDKERQFERFLQHFHELQGSVA